MGRKNRHKVRFLKPFCYYCDREFDDEFILHHHQKSRHFSCQVCHKKFSTAVSMATHVLQVHKDQVHKVPNAKAGRDAIQLDIFGMEGVPKELIEQRMGSQPSKVAKTETFQDSLSGRQVKDQENVVMVYKDDEVSVEEKRACLSRYRYILVQN